MSTIEIRVRPVIRHVVTRYTSTHDTAGSEVLGEFDNERGAEEVAEAMADKAAPKVYALVQETVGEVNAKVYYAYSEREAQERLAALRQDPATKDESYRVYSRVKERL